MTKTAKKLLFQFQNYKQLNFVDIEHFFAKHDFDYKGELEMFFGKFEDIILWTGWNQAAIDVLKELLDSKKIEIAEMSVNAACMCYIQDGKVQKYPIVKRIYQYKKPHWLPVFFELKENEINEQ